MLYSGKFLEIDKPNIHGHIYTMKMVKKVVKKFKQQKDFMLGKWYLNETLCPGDAMTCNLVDVSHKVVDIRIDGNNAICDIDILETPQGKLLQTVIDKGVRIAPYIIGTADWESGKFELNRIDIIPLDRAVWEECELKKI